MITLLYTEGVFFCLVVSLCFKSNSQNVKKCSNHTSHLPLKSPQFPCPQPLYVVMIDFLSLTIKLIQLAIPYTSTYPQKNKKKHSSRLYSIFTLCNLISILQILYPLSPHHLSKLSHINKTYLATTSYHTTPQSSPFPQRLHLTHLILTQYQRLFIPINQLSNHSFLGYIFLYL